MTRMTTRPVAHTTDRIAPRAPRRHVLGWGMGEVALLMLVALAIVGAFTVLSWVVGR